MKSTVIAMSRILPGEIILLNRPVVELNFINILDPALECLY